MTLPPKLLVLPPHNFHNNMFFHFFNFGSFRHHINVTFLICLPHKVILIIITSCTAAPIFWGASSPMLAHPNSGLSSTRQIGIGVCAKIEIIATAAKIPAMTATAMMIFLFINVLFLTFQPLYLLFAIVAKRICHHFMPASARNFLSD